MKNATQQHVENLSLDPRPCRWMCCILKKKKTILQNKQSMTLGKLSQAETVKINKNQDLKRFIFI